MRRTIEAATCQKQSGKITLPVLIINGSTAKAQLKLADTSYYQVGPHGDYVQEAGY